MGLHGFVWHGIPHANPALQGHQPISQRPANLSRKLTYLPLQGSDEQPCLSTYHLGMESGPQRMFQSLGSWMPGSPHTS
jgi:hypothetical protein